MVITSGPTRREARTLVVSLRNLMPTAARAGNYELEDVIVAVDDADLFAPSRALGPSLLLQRALGRVRRTIPAMRRLPDFARRPVDRDYDLVVLVAQSVANLYEYGPISAWRRCASRVVAIVDELWLPSVPERTGEMHLLAQLDTLYLGCAATVPAVAARTGRPVHYFPPGADALRFCPLDLDAPRAIDLHNMGRRSAASHAAFLELARERGWFYYYDTFAQNPVMDVVQHRERMADLIRRSRYFVANKAKVTRAFETGGQEEVGYRFFEGAAGGAVLIGEAPDCEPFRTLFDWPDAVVPLPYGSSDVRAVIDELEADPERVARVRRANVLNSLERHDWCYRWERVLAAEGLTPAPGLSRRKAALAQRADALRRDGAGGQQADAPARGRLNGALSAPSAQLSR